MRGRWLTTTLAILIGPVATASAQMAPPAVHTAVATEQSVQEHRRMTGSLRAVSRGDVAALEEGRILDITVREGADVRQGDVIARIDARRLVAQQKELKASLETVKAQIQQRAAEVEQARRDYERAERLASSNTLTVQELQQRETDLAIAKAQHASEERRLAEVKSQLELIDVRLEDTVVRAPYDGRVVQRHAEPGEWIRPGEPFVTLVSRGTIEAWLDVPERYAHIVPHLQEATRAEETLSIQIPGTDQPFPVSAVRRVPDVHPRTRTFAMVLTLSDHNGRLTPGMSVEAWLPVGDRELRLTVPKDAVIRDGRTAYVYKVATQGEQTTAERSAVSVLFETGLMAVVEGGTLAAGDRVVVEGNERLMPGMPISARDRDEPSIERRLATSAR